jgi:hypothetical protein
LLTQISFDSFLGETVCFADDVCGLNFNLACNVVSDPASEALYTIWGDCNCPSGFDECGECGGIGILVGACDCFGNVEDDCGICGGDNSSCLSIQDPIPESFSINNIYPNPFNPIVSITYGVPTSQYVEGYIYNLSGDRISTLVSHYHSLGNYSLEWNATGNPSGIYIFILKTNSNVKSRKLVLLK